MKIAHLILTHKNPEQLERLVRSLDHPHCHCFVHIDKKTDITPFLHLQERGNVSFIRKRVKIYWAGFGTIQATINGFEEILPKGFDYINVISGQDFPIKPAPYIYQYIRDRKGTEFITCETVGVQWPEARVRMTQYHLVNWRIPGKHRLEIVANKLLPQRKFPLKFTIVGRSNWFTITAPAARYALEFLKHNPSVVRFFKLSWGADELIFSTILYNSPFREKIEPNLVYVDWRGRTDGHPKILTMTDLEDLKASDRLFARKFDSAVDNAVLKALEQDVAVGPEEIRQ